MVWVSDDEAELVEGYRQEQADLAKKATNMGPFEPSTPAYKSYIPASQKQQDTTGLDWFDAGGVSAYHDPKTGNTWGNGLWYDPGGNVWNDDAGAWQTPQEYNTFWSDIYQHDAGITGVMGMQAPESGPAGYDLFTDWSALTAPEPEMGPFEPYSLDFKQPSPILTKPWDLPFGMADRLIDADDDTGWGGPVGKILRKTGQVFADRTQRIPEIAPFLLRGLGATGGGNPSQEQLGEIYQKDILPNVSGNEFIRTFTPYDPDNLPGPLPYLTDALAPINFATAGIAPSAPFLGAMFKGPYLKNLAAEMGIDIGARLLSEQAAGERGEAIPFFGDQPAWLRALEGGLVGGLGAAGAIKGADVGIPAAMKYMGEEVEVAPGQFVKIGEFGGAKFGPVEPDGARPELRVTGERPKRIVGFDYEFPSGVKQGDTIDTPYGKVEVYSVLMPEDGIGTVRGQFVKTDPKLGVSKTDTVMIRRSTPDPEMVADAKLRVERYNIAAKDPANHELLELKWEPEVGPNGDVAAWRFFGAGDPIERLPDGTWRVVVEGVPFHGRTAQEALDKVHAAGRARMEAQKTTPGRLNPYDAPLSSFAETPKLAADAASATDARITLLDALDKERAFRESGEAEALIREGRATQAKGIAGSIGETRGGTFEEALAGASAGARVGAMLPTSQGLSLSDDALGVITKELQDYALETGKTFDYLTAMKAVSKLQDGIHLQPAEIKQLGRVFGAEVEAAIRNTNAGRIATVAELTPEDLVKITRLAEADGKKAARAEVESQAQHKLADDLDRRLRMNPTNKRLATAASDARARAVKLEADSERYMLDRIERLEAQARAKTQRAEIAANREEVRQAEMRDKELAKQEAVIRKKAENEWIAGLTRSEADPYATMLNKQETREARRLSAAQEAAKKAAGDRAAAEWAKSLDDQKPDAFARQLRAQEEREARALGKFQDRAKTVQAENVATQTYKESGAKALDKALATIDKTDLPDSVKATAKEAVGQWVKADGVVLDSMKGDAPGFLRVVYAGATGEVADSWTSALIEQRGFMRGVLQDMGFDAKTADTISKALSEMEVLRRWGPEPPAHITKSLDQAKRSFGVGDNAITGLASISQEFKNIMFGIADIGILGIQGLVAGAQGLAPMLAGTVNRVLNVARLGVDTSPGNLAKRVQYGLDGRIRGGATYTGAVDPTAGTLLRHIPGLKTIDQKYISRYIGAVNDLQFRHIMGFLGDLIHEGQLSMLKITGSDITDPLVRKQSAEFANAISSAGKLSQRSGRGNLERAFILSPSMVRSQMQVLGKIGRLLGPTTTRENRIMAASILVSYGATLAAVGKYLNDAIGTDDFEFDPSKPGAWQIRLSSGRVVNLFPQTQLFRLLAQSGRVLAEEGQGEMDAERIGKAWLNFGIGRLSPAVSIGSSAAGVGFDPESGWRYGDLNHGKSWWEQLRDNVLPVPPLVDSIAREGLSAQGTTMSALGLSNYQESEWSAREREIKADPRFGGRGWNELEPSEKAIVNAEGGRVYSRDPEIRSQQERADVIAGDAKAYQEKIDQWFQTGQKPDGTPYTAEDWKRDRALNDKFVAGRYEELYAGVDWKKDDLNPVDLYYKAIADARDPLTDDVNWDKVDAWKATLSEEDRAYIERNTNLRDTVLEQQWRQDVKLLSDSGYFDAENKVAVRKADPEIAVAVRRWGYSEMSVKAEDVVMKYTAQQEVDDRALEQGQITPAQWHDNYNKRRDQLRAEKEGIYAGMKDDGVATDPLDAYFSEIDKAVKPNGIDIDWTRVDAWVAQQPADVQEVINTYVSPGLTPVVDQYKAAVNEIEESGYWTINDKVTAYWAKANGIDYPEGTNADAFWGEIQQEVYTKVKAKGYSTIEAQSLTNVVMGQLQKDYLEVAGKVRAAARDSSPELTRLLVSWGFWEPGKKDTAELLAAGTLR